MIIKNVIIIIKLCKTGKKQWTKINVATFTSSSTMLQQSGCSNIEISVGPTSRSIREEGLDHSLCLPQDLNFSPTIHTVFLLQYTHALGERLHVLSYFL